MHCKWCLKLCMVWRIRVTINRNMKSKLAGTTMSKVSFEGVVALKRAGLVLKGRVFRRNEDEQSLLYKVSRPNRLFSEAPLLQKRLVVPASLLFIFVFIVTLMYCKVIFRKK